MGEIIVFSGLAGVGTSTLSKSVAEHLGYPRYTAGPYFRLFGQLLGIPIEESTRFPHILHSYIDRLMIRRMRTENNAVLEGWLTGYHAAKNNIESTRFKVTCPDKIRFNRIAQRDNLYYKVAEENTRKREAENRELYAELYKIEDFLDDRYFSYVVDSGENDQLGLLKLTLGLLGKVNALSLASQ